METHRGTGRSTLLKPHTQFCGCCCSLKTGVITGCSLFILLYSVAIIGVNKERQSLGAYRMMPAFLRVTRCDGVHVCTRARCVCQ